jgi:putative restriction endonuclease
MRSVSQPTRQQWSRDELTLACRLYFTLPFGQMHARNPKIIEVAGLLGRTPSSLAMKLVNFASLDPAQQARGIKGLAGHSRADERIWSEFLSNWDEMAVLSEAKLQALYAGRPSQDIAADEMIAGGNRRTESESLGRVRTMQGFFRKVVLAAHHSRCCVTGNPVEDLLVASHILPWSAFPEQRLNPRNGLCLAAHFDKTFDCGLVTFDGRLRLTLSPALRRYLPNEAVESEFSPAGRASSRVS